MNRASMRTVAATLACAVALLVGTTATGLAQSNHQQGLVNVNVQDLALQIPASVAVPVSVAADVCGLSVAAIQEAGNECDATSNSLALSQAVADTMLGTDRANGGNGGQNSQSGLVNVNLQNLGLQVPVSVALPIGVAANVCGVNVLAIQQQDNTCTAQSTAAGMSGALAQALLAETS